MGLRNMMSSPFSPTFCVYPWIEFIMGPDKHARVCCIARSPILSKEGHAYPMNEFPPEKIWNSEGMREVRRKMLCGEKNKECEHCYYQESIGRTSFRESFNRQWLRSKYGTEILKRVKQSKINDHQVDASPLYLDIRPGNLCNLKCRMCNPGNSSLIHREQKELLEEKKEFSSLVNNGFFQNDDSFYNWHESSQIWDDVYKWSSGIKQLYFTGGEPTLIKRNWELINHFQEKGYSKEITLNFNINGTYIPQKLLDTFDHFSHVCITFSIDGYKKVQEYIRYPSKWSLLEKNVMKILKRKKENVGISFSPVVQVYNILYLTDLLRWIDHLQEEYGSIGTSLLICTEPDYLDIAILPQNIKKEALRKIHDYEENYQKKDHTLMDNLLGIKNILKKVNEKEKQMEFFFQYTSILDKKRGNSFKKNLPELHDLLLDR